MSSAESDLAVEMVQVFRQVHGEIPFTLDFVAEVVGVPGCTTYGVCDFSRSPPAIAICSGQDEKDLIENLCHELAHLVAGFAAGHNEAWEQLRDELSVRFGSRRFHV